MHAKVGNDNACRDVGVRLAGSSDVDGIVQVHKAAFPDYYLTHLGDGLLRRYYLVYLMHPDGINVVALNAKHVCAFISGMVGPSNILKTFYRKHLGYVIWATFRKMVTFDPVVLKGVWSRFGHVSIALRSIIFRRGKPLPDVGSNPRAAPVGRLVSIAVTPECRGTTVGIEMILFFEEQLRRRGTGEVRLCVNADNLRAIRFYKKAGWFVLEDRGDEMVFAKRLNA